MKCYEKVILLWVALLLPFSLFGAVQPDLVTAKGELARFHVTPYPERDDADQDSVVYEYGFEDGWSGWTHRDLTDAGIQWHVTETNAYDEGSSWWCGDEEIGGYDNHWLQYLMTPVLDLTDRENLALTFMLYYNCEDPEEGQPPPDTMGYDAWDGCNMWISTDGGEEWEVIEAVEPEYDYESLYSFGVEWGMGTDIPGWAGFRGEWLEGSVDLSDYAQENVQIAWVFCSDPAWKTGDDGDPDGEAIGMVVDEMLITAGDDVVWENDGTEIGDMERASGETSGDYWEISDETGHESDHSAHCPIEAILVDALISPPLEIPGEGYYTYFDFWMICNTVMSNADPDADNTLDDYFRIEVSNDEGVNWQDMIYDYGHPEQRPDWYEEWAQYGPDSWFRIDMPEWRRKLNLTQFAGETVMLRWVLKTDDVMEDDQGTGLWIDDFRLMTTERRENDVGIEYMLIGYPIGIGLRTDCQIMVKNFGMMTQNNVRKYYQLGDGRVTPITPWQGDLEADSSRAYNFRLQNFDFAGGSTVAAWTALPDDENEENDRAVSEITIYPEGMYQLGYDSRTVRDEIRFAQNNGPAVLFTPSDDGVDGDFNILALNVQWGSENQDGEAVTMLQIFQDNRGRFGQRLYSEDITVTPDDLSPNVQQINLGEIENLQNLDADFWIYFHISDDNQWPLPLGKAIEGNDPNPGAGHYYVSNGNAVEERDFEFQIQALIINTEAAEAPLLPGAPEVDFEQVDPDSSMTIRLPVFGSSSETVTITNATTNNELFSVESVEELPHDLAAGEYAYFDITFTPGGEEDRWTANLTIICLEAEPVVIRLVGRSTEGVADDVDAIPLEFALGEAYPNPFNATAVIPFSLPHAADVKLAVYDLAGRKVADLVSGNMNAGYHEVTLNAENLAVGIYLYKLEAGEFSTVRKIALIK